MEKKIDFVGGNTGKCFWIMFLPVMAAMFLNMAYNVVDSLWIGNLLGEKAYAALTGATPIILILNSVAMGATNGVAILVSQALGAKDEKRTNSVIATSFLLAILFAVTVTIFLELCLPHILHILNTPEETWQMAEEYLSIYILGYITVYLYCYLTAVLRSFGNAVFQMAAMLVCTVLNAGLDPLFISKIGLKGAAVATVLAQVICLLFMAVYLKGKHIFSLRLESFDIRIAGETVKKAIPSVFQQSIPAVSTGVLTSLVSQVSITAIAAYGVIGKMEILLFYPAMALNMVLTNIIGQCHGAKRRDRGMAYLKYALKAGAAMLFALSLFVVGFAKQISSLFLKDGAVGKIVAGYFLIVSIGYVLNTVTNCFLGMLNGIGQPAKSMVLMIFYYLIVRIPLAGLFYQLGLGMNGIWTAVLISHITASVAAVWAGIKERK